MFFQPYWFKQSLCGRQTSQMDHNNPALGWHFNHNLLRDLWNREVRLCVLSCFGHVRLFATLWILACQAALSMGFPRQEYWSGLPCPSPGDLSGPEIESTSLESPSLAGRVYCWAIREAHPFGWLGNKSSETLSCPGCVLSVGMCQEAAVQLWWA